MPGEVDIVVRTLDEIEEEVAWDDPVGIAKFTPEKLATFRTNPLRAGDDDPAQLIALVGRSVVGRVDVFRGELEVFGERVAIFWGSALHVPIEFRSTGAGAMLIMRMSSLPASVGGFGFSRAAIPLYKGLRWTSFELPRWILLVHSRSVFESALAPAPQRLRRPMAQVLGKAADPMLALRARRRTRRGRPILRPELAGSVPAALDHAFPTDDTRVIPHRSARHTSWLLSASFGETAASTDERLLYAVRDHAGTIVGWFLIGLRFHETAQGRFRDVRLGTVLDWVVLDELVGADELIVIALEELVRKGADAVELIEVDAHAGAVARRLGLRRLGSTHLMFRAARGTRLADSAAAKPENWRIRPSDGDAALA